MKIMFKVGEENIFLTENSGGSGFQLGKEVWKKDKETGEKKKEIKGLNWFSTLPSAFGKLMEMKLRTSDAKTLAELQRDIAKAREDLAGDYSLAWEANK